MEKASFQELHDRMRTQQQVLERLRSELECLRQEAVCAGWIVASGLD